MRVLKFSENGRINGRVQQKWAHFVVNAPINGRKWAHFHQKWARDLYLSAVATTVYLVAYYLVSLVSRSKLDRNTPDAAAGDEKMVINAMKTAVEIFTNVFFLCYLFLETSKSMAIRSLLGHVTDLTAGCSVVSPLIFNLASNPGLYNVAPVQFALNECLVILGQTISKVYIHVKKQFEEKEANRSEANRSEANKSE